MMTVVDDSRQEDLLVATCCCSVQMTAIITVPWVLLLL